MTSAAKGSIRELDVIGRFLPDLAERGPGGRGGDLLAFASEAVATTEPTPVSQIRVVVDGRPRRVSLKLEGRSRWGSIKGRTALALLASVASRIGPRSRIIESTSGNLGIAMAGICREVGIAFTAVVDARLPPAMLTRMAGYGARTVSVDEAGAAGDALHLLRRIARVKEILGQDPDAVWTNQYENRANTAVHRWWTGHEVHQQLGADLQAVFCPVSTGGSFKGIHDCLASTRPWLECVAVDVHGSTVFGGAAHRRLLTGIGASRRSSFLDADHPPRHVVVSDTEAIAACRALAGDLGLAVGGSSGATIAGCLRYLWERPDLEHVLCVCPDLGGNYRETLYDDGWLVDQGAAAALARPAIHGEQISFTRPALTARREEVR